MFALHTGVYVYHDESKEDPTRDNATLSYSESLLILNNVAFPTLPWLGISDGGPHMAVLEFRHSCWNEDSEYFGFCNFAWGETLLMLKQWCES